jgi:lysosomal Pro-X carboxypeptidase
MFPTRKWDLENFKKDCQSKYGTIPQEDYIIDLYGGRELTDFQDYSNIFFSSGKRDPWSAGSINRSISENIIAYVIDDAAHHLDLRAPNDNDPPGV